MLFRSLLPAAIALAERDPRVVSLDGLLPQERAAVANAVPKRQREYAAGRTLARQLLGQLGGPTGALVSDPDRTARWPAGFVGSITHCDSLAAVAVARADQHRSLGLDVEPALPLPAGLDRLVLLPADRLNPVAGLVYERLVFSAKEAVYKALYPVMRQFLDFQEVSVSFSQDSPDGGGFVATLLRAAPPFSAGARFEGRWRADETHLATAVVLPR